MSRTVAVQILTMLSESSLLFYYVRNSGIDSSLSKLSNKFEAWRRIVETGDTARDEKFSSLNRSMLAVYGTI